MKVKNVILLFIFMTSITFSVSSQTRTFKKAEEAFEAKEYFTAKDLYKEAKSESKNKSLKADIYFKIAECYRNLNDSKKAEKNYKKAIKKKYSDAIVFFYYAETMRMNEKYEEAMSQYEKFLSSIPNNENGMKGLESCKLASEWKNDPTRYIVKNKAFFNSKEGDFSPTFAKKDNSIIFFTSSRSGAHGEQFNNVSGENFTDIFKTQIDKKGKWSTPIPLGVNVNSEFDEGASVLDAKMKTLYFTRCEIIKNQMVPCKIFMSKKKGSDWGVPEKLKLVADSISVRHPAISSDGKFLYFVTDMRGGRGKKDIWYVERKNKSWSKPKNIGSEINTPGNERFPYIAQNGNLYFASDGHIGMGGMDIFKAMKDEDGMWMVENMKYPINSSGDDFGIIIEGMTQNGFFTSNRAGGKGRDDIYSFILPPLVFSISGTVKDVKDASVLSGVKVKLMGSDGTITEVITNSEGSFKFPLKANTDYQITAFKKKFFIEKTKETTKGVKKSKEFTTEIFLETSVKPIVLESVQYDVGKFDLRPEAMAELDNLVIVLNDNPDMIVELSSHTDFTGDYEENKELSQKRAQSVVDYLVDKDIAAERLTAKGYGSDAPRVIDEKLASKFPFLNIGDILNENFIVNLTSKEERKAAHQLNRRTEFKNRQK
ncbi:MAG: hypothetical protein B6I24_03730 [Bacteroidetes bacterium 4572_128]|nr:MAG: hypothetical protein B6I24_03730 [Bacteroidetes bacterium 4572_128]